MIRQFGNSSIRQFVNPPILYLTRAREDVAVWRCGTDRSSQNGLLKLTRRE